MPSRHFAALSHRFIPTLACLGMVFSVGCAGRLSGVVDFDAEIDFDSKKTLAFYEDAYPLERKQTETRQLIRAAIEQNLLIIDHAIAEIHRAMKNRAESHTLNLLLAETYRREAELLRQLEWWSPAPEEKNS